MTPSCLTCRHSEPADLGQLALECRRYPPILLMPANTDTPQMAFPQVGEGDWCGCYEPEQETTT
jgi:hypothetical protein